MDKSKLLATAFAVAALSFTRFCEGN